MSLAKLFYLKETFRESVRRWRQVCFRKRSALGNSHASRLTSLASRFTLEALEPRLLLSATPTEVIATQALEPAAITVPAGSLPSLDVDLNGQADALSDGILIIRHLFGFTGTSLTNGAVDPAGQRTDPTAIATYLDSIRMTALDVDLNQQADALSDGIMVIRSLFGFTGTALTSGAIDPAGQRTDPAVIAAFLDNMNPQRELIAPLMTAGLQQDTGISMTDAITFNPTITGTLADISQIASFTAGFDGTPVGSLVDVLEDLSGTGHFTLSTVRLNQLAGGTLADGTHTLHLRATDARGNIATIDRTFTLDTLAPLSPTFDLAVTSDTGTVGDQQTTAAIVTIKGLTDATTAIQVVGPGTSTLSNGTGTFQLPDLTLAVGANAFTLRASDVAGNHTDFSRTITRLAATQQADVVLTWNQTMLDAIQRDATAPPVASRGMAMVSLAMYDTINAIEGTPGYYVSLPAQAGTSADAAAAAAAHRVLSYLYPGQQTLFDTQLAASLASIPDGAAKTNGVTLGQSIADAIIAIRATDGWNDFVDYTPGNQPGDWQQTAPMYDVALLPQWADLTPFALTSPDQFRPAGPPALTSQVYADAVNEVKALGSATGSTRTADQTQIARFWADGAGTFTPPGHWNQIAEQIALQQGNSLSANARLFAELNVALADAGITAWNTKYADAFWRPVTAIQQADLDGNALTVVDPTWSSFLITPPFPEYISGHSTFSGAAAEILTSVFGTVPFTTTSLGLPAVQRSFTSFEQAAQEAGRSRIYGGIHFEFSNQDGLTAGRQLAQFVLNRFTVTTDTQGPTILLNQEHNAVTNTNLTLTGQVLDNLSGVAALQAKLDAGAFAPVTLSATGTFSLPTTLALDGTADGLHTVTFQATDHTGNSSTLVFTFTLDTQAPIITLTSPLEGATLTLDTRLSGTADATGSNLVELCYKFDNGTLVPVSFDATTGSFDTPLDLSRLVVGVHTLSLRAQDAAGNATTITRNVTLAAPIPLTITTVTPQQGLSNVGTTFRPQVFFSRPINSGSLTSTNFYATDSAGTRLTATIVPSQDGTFAWLFFGNPMPGGETMTVHVVGDTILAAGDGQALDADGNGTPGGTFTSTFSTVSLVPLQGTRLSGKVLDPGPDLKTMTFDDIRVGPDGVLHTSDDLYLNPLAGVKVYIVGLESQAVFTDAQGNFSFNAVPSGDIKLAVDGRTATNAPTGFYFPEMVMDLQIEVGQANTVMGTMGTREAKAANLTRPEVYLPRLQTSILQTVSNTQNTMIDVSADAAPNLTDQQRQFLTLEVQPGSLIGPNGQPLTSGQVGISTVPPELVRDMLPPGLLQHTFDITIQAPDAATFNTPLQMTFPNVFNAAPGTKLNFLSFDHTTGRLVVEGTATVSADGLFVTTDPDTGITKPGWHGMTPPTTPGRSDPPFVWSQPPSGSGGSIGGGPSAPGGGPGGPPGGGGGGSGVGYIPIPPMVDVGVSYFICLRLTALGTVLNLRSATDGSFYFQNLPPNQPYELTVYNPDSGLVWNTSGTTAPTGQATVFGTPNFVVSVAPDLNTNGVPDDIDCAMGQGRFLDFGTDLSPVAIGYQGVTNATAYSVAQGYGWLTGAITAVDRSSFADVGALRRDFNAVTLGEFGVDVTPGVYDVTVTLGDALSPHEVMKVSIEGELRANISTQAGKFYAATYRIVVTDGRVNVALDGSGGTDPLIVVNAIDVVRIGDVPDGATGPVTVTTSGGLHYFVLENLDTGFIMRGQQVISPSSPFLCPEGVLLAPNTRYRQHVFSVETLQVAYSEFTTPSSGTPFDMPAIMMAQSIALDADVDGLPDDAEFIIGTQANANDSDGDGITDLAEVQQGLDPLGGRALPTGVIATLSLRGETKEVVLEGALANPDQLTAYVATGSYGLAIVDATQFQRPVVLSQLDLAGDATDVSVENRLGIAVVAANAGGLHFVDVSNQVSPTLIRTIATTPNQVEVFDGFAYVTVGGDLRSYNLMTGELVQRVSVSTAALVGLAREGNMLYTTDTANVLRAVSVSAGALTSRGALTIPLVFGQTIGSVFVGNGIAYVGAEGGFSGGFATADVSNPDALVLLSGVDGAGIAGKRVVANGSGLGVSVGRPGGAGGPSVLDVVSLTDPTNTNNFLTRFTLPTDPFSVAIGAGIAFVADGTGGLQVVNYRAFDNQGLAPTVFITSPVVDVDPGTLGIQLTAGSAIPIRVNAADDVQVRNVEMLVNGVVVSNDVSFPFDLSALALGSTPSSTTTTVQVRATDTGGNVAVSNTLTIQLVPDTFPPTLVSSNVSDGAIKDRSFRTIQLRFSESLDPASVTAQNFELRNPLGTAVAPTAIQLLSDGSVVQLTFNPLDVGTNQFVVRSANVTDQAGNALGSQDVVISFDIFSNVVPALNPLPALGSRMYVKTVSGQITAPLGSESFTISLDAGQTVTMGVFPDSAALRPRVELLDSTGAVLGAAESSEIGVGVTLQAVPIPTTGLYTLRVQSVSGIGAFRAVVYLNALQENEFFGGPKNDTLATAMNLSPSSLPLQGSADRMAVIGVADGGNDFYRVDLTQNQVMFAVLNAFGGGNIDLDLRDSAGTVLTLGQANFPGLSKGIFAFQAPTAGSYYLNVTGLPDADAVLGIPRYSLVVTRGAAFEYLSNDTLATAQGFALTGQALGSVGTRVFPQNGATVTDPIDFYSFLANAGDVLTITTATPGDGIGEPTNTLDPALQLYNPTGALIATNLNGASDGRNAIISTTAAMTGQYKIAVLPTAGAGDYTVRVTGATGQVTFNFQVDSSGLRSNASQASAFLHFTIPPLLSSISPGDVTVNGIAASSVDVVDAQTLRFNVSGVTPVGGGYTVNLPAGMIQDLHGNGNPAFSRLFTGDTTAPTVTASSINAMTVLEPDAPGTFTPLTVTFTFSEAIDQTTLTTDDVQFRTSIAGDEFDSNVINAASVTYNATLNQLTAVFNWGRSRLNTLTLVSGATGIHDLAGNPLNGSPNFPLPSGQGNPAPDNYVVEFGGGPATPSFTPFGSDLPSGSLLYFPDQDLVSTFASPGETDVWTVDLKAGQTMGIGLTPTSAIQGRLTVVDPNGVTVGTISSIAPGKPFAMAGVPIAMAGTYRVEVTSLAGIGVYSVGFGLNSAFDVEFPILSTPSTGTNNTMATAQPIAVSAIPLQGTASRLAVQGGLSSPFDADLYSFQLTAGQPATLLLKMLDVADAPVLELLGADGSLLATGALSADGVRLSDYVPSQSGTYLARVATGGGGFEYNLVVTRGASFEQPGTDTAPQDLTLSGQVLGGLEQQGHGANGAIRVAVLGGAGAVPLVSQLNDDTYYDFDAVAVTGTDIDTFAELSNYDVVVIGDSTSRAQLQGPVEQALTNWWYARGGGLVGTGGLITAAGPAGGGTLFGLDNVIPINLNALSTQTTNPTLTITPDLHEVTQGLSTFDVNGNVELPAGTVDQNAVLLGTVNGAPSIVAFDQWDSGQGPRSAFVGPMYFDAAATGLRNGSADRLLEQTIAWASHVDTMDAYRVNANAGDQLVIQTTTPLDGPHLPQNLLDPRIELLNPAGTLVASNNNGAPDGKNALLNYTVPLGGSGTYTIRIRGAGAGEYTVAVTGATGVASSSSASMTTLVADTSLSVEPTSGSSLDGSLAYVQQSWVVDYVAPTADLTADDEELLIQLV